jgi:glycosyltransferase involved in cell wall biosynthesis
MTAALVSIIVPCYNAEPWLAATLDSALAQTWPEREIILVDDGSRDRSLAVGREYEARGVRVVAQPNQGASAARNAGLRAARGAFIQFLDADDLLAADKIEQQMRLLAAGNGSRVATGAWARFETDPAGAIFTPQANWGDLGGPEFLQLNYEQVTMMHPAAWLAPRNLLDQAGPWDESLSLNDDGEYFARVALAAERIVFCPGARSYYRSNLRGSLSARVDRRSLESLFRSTELTLRHLLAADSSPRSRAAAAYAWKWMAFELYPGAPDLARTAEASSRALGGSRRPYPAGGRFQLAARVLGWRLAKRLTLSRTR